MLNRLYIVIGVLAILLLGAGFVVPRLIDWSGYRDRLETMAEEGLGTDVIIAGEINFVLLPQPQIRLGRTIIGPAFYPLIEIESIVADFSLMDFLRDQFAITNLVLTSPKVNLNIDKDGEFQIPLSLPQGMEQSKISVAKAKIVDGALSLTDRRSGEDWRIEGFEGELSISGVRGPFNLRGQTNYQGVPHFLRISIGGINENSSTLASVFWKPDSGAYTVSGEGIMSFGADPKFVGEGTFRFAPESAIGAASQADSVGEEAIVDQVQGDFVLTSELEISSDKLLFSAFEVAMDENQAGSRLTGAGVVRFGAESDFDAVISASVVALAPVDYRRDINASSASIFDLLSQLPALPVPPMKGRIGGDIVELSIAEFGLRNLRIDALSDGQSWTLENLTGQLPGESVLHLAGDILASEGKFGYAGRVELSSKRLGSLARLWTHVDDVDPIHTSSANLQADINLENSVLAVRNGELILGELPLEGKAHTFAGQFDVGQVRGNREEVRSALFSMRLSSMDVAQSGIFSSLMPDFTPGSRFAQNFPHGALDIVAEEITVLGLSGQSVALQLNWTPTNIHVERFSAVDFGGAQVSLTGEISGGILSPDISGGGRFTLTEDGSMDFVDVLVSQLGGSEELKSWFAAARPLDMNFDISPIEDGGAQIMSAVGRSRQSVFEAELRMEDGLRNLTRAPLDLVAKIQAEDGDDLAAQLALGSQSLLGEGTPVTLNLSAQGTLSNSLQTNILAEARGEHLGYSGSLILSDLSQVRGRGSVDFSLKDFAPMLDLMGVGGIHLPPASGISNVDFVAGKSVILENLMVSGDIGEDSPLTGGLTVTNGETGMSIVGQLNVVPLQVEQIYSVLAGPAALISGESIWPEGPIDLGPGRQMTSKIHIVTSKILADNHAFLQDVSFDLVLDQNSISLANISGKNDTGTIVGNVELCCTGSEFSYQFSARASLVNIPLEGIFPGGISDNLTGVVDAGFFVESNGASFTEIVDALSGEGSFSLANAQLSHFDPAVFDSLSGEPRLADLDSDALLNFMEISLQRGSFRPDPISGIFQIAGGNLRATRLFAQGETARLLGAIRVDFSDLSLSGDWVLSPLALSDPDGLITPNNAELNILLSGSLTAPERQLDAGQLVDAIDLRVLELELDELERLRTEQIARSREVALERERLIAQDAERAAQAAAEAAARQAAAQEAEVVRQRERDAAAAAARNAAPLVFEFESQDPLLFNHQPADLLSTDVPNQ